MRWRPRLITCISLLLCLLLSAVSGCAPATAPEALTEPAATASAAGGVRFTDMGGNEIALPAPATRIVALTPADVEILFAIGAGDALVGCGEYCNYPSEAAAIPVVQSGVDINMEQLLAAAPEVLLLNPQMLSTGAVASTEEQVARLAETGIRVVISNALDLAGVYEAIEMLGALTGRDAEAAGVIEGMRTAFTGISADGAADGKTVYFEISPLEYGLWTAGTGTFMNEIAGMLGLTNCFADVTEYGEISEEQVLARNPDYIVTITMYFGEGTTPVEEILSRPGWENISAVQSGAILNLQNDELSRPGPRLADGAKLLAELVNGAADEAS